MVATCDWCIKLPQAKLFHKTSSALDHNPLLLQLFSGTQRKKHGNFFQFEAMWLKQASCEKVVSSTWEEGLFLNVDFQLMPIWIPLILLKLKIEKYCSKTRVL